MDKEKLIDAIQQKGLGNSLISIYYNIGRALPFRAQRFPDGRVSEWYRNQYVEVYKVKPSGKGGKFGKAYGFYYRNGERADAWEGDPARSWCRENDKEPQEIPCAACGSWVLLDILGEPTKETTKVYGVNDVLEKGKYKGKTVAEVLRTDWPWIEWANGHSLHFHFDIDEIIEEKKKSIKTLHPDDVLPFGKYKGNTIRFIAENDYKYLRWVDEKSDGYFIAFDELGDKENYIKVLHPDDVLTCGKYEGRTVREVFNLDLTYLNWLDENGKDFVVDFEELRENFRRALGFHSNKE